VEVRFDSAAAMPGTARFQIAAASGRWADAASVELPTWTPATTEAFAVYGELDGGALVQPVEAPPDVVLAFGGLEITTSVTAVAALTDAFLYLQAYPFECAEQLASRILSTAALRDVLQAFNVADMPAPAEIEAAMKRDIERLRSMQSWDGGFGFWRRGDHAWPYLTVHVTHALGRASQKGYAVPREMVSRALGYLRGIDGHIPGWYSAESRLAIQAYAVYVRALQDDPDPKRTEQLAGAMPLDKMPLEVVGWLLSALEGHKAQADLAARLARHLANRATETAATAQFATHYTDGAHVLLHSSRRSDAVILSALIGHDPKSDLIPKVVRGLLGHKKKGRWGNTQENVFVLLALDRYFKTFEAVTPDLVARLWLGDGYAGAHEFRGRTTEEKHTAIPMAALAEGGAGPKDLTLAHEGKGRLYYRLGLRYAPSSLKLDPAEHGFTVERVYEAVDAPDDVRRDDDGTWRIRAGARVRVRLTMVAPERRYHVALVDKLPAGFEPMNPALAVTGQVPADPQAQSGAGRWWWFLGPWYEHQNLRDERAEAFSSLVWPGVHTWSYVARATTPGHFVAPPAKAEEMYHPETFGRSQTDRVVVE
jgi:uncharacterized protein YfaS (alpha-2-macroglobulin family)